MYAVEETKNVSRDYATFDDLSMQLWTAVRTFTMASILFSSSKAKYLVKQRFTATTMRQYVDFKATVFNFTKCFSSCYTMFECSPGAAGSQQCSFSLTHNCVASLCYGIKRDVYSPFIERCAVAADGMLPHPGLYDLLGNLSTKMASLTTIIVIWQ
jgi:hypothetical protein